MMKISVIKRIYKGFAGLLSCGVMVLLLYTLHLQDTLPNHFNVEQGENLHLEYYNKYLSCGLTSKEFPIDVYKSTGNSYQMSVRLWGAVHVKDVNVQVVDRREVIPCGTPFGIKMFTDGVMIVGIGDVDCGGKLVNPAKEAGLQVGDVVVEMDGETTLSNKAVAKIISKSNGKPINVTIKRGGYTHETLLHPVKSSIDNNYKIGLWVRDSSAGIGTMTYYDNNSGIFAGLGHAICDVDTQTIMPLSQGEVVEASITGVRRGEAGNPGELKGVFTNNGQLGSLCANSNTGVYGTLSRLPEPSLSLPVAFSYEVKEGKATILTTISGSQPKEYDVMIEKINHSDTEPTKNMVIRITDSELLEKTGGIVQGMSGSPILQNGCLAGAVTHVFVNDPTKGYGIFAENMDKTLQSAAVQESMAA